MNCLLSPSLLENELRWLGSEAPFAHAWGRDGNGVNAEVSAFRVRKTSLRELSRRLWALKAACEKGARRAEWMGRLLLALDMLRNSLAPASAPSLAKEDFHPSVRAALEFFRREISREWTLSALSGLLGINPCYLVRIFRRQIGLPPIKYLAQLRAEQSATLLVSTSRCVGEIGARVGCPDPKNFSRIFKRHFGVSATVYRREMQASASDGKTSA